jgi:hypothetical protein
VSKHLADQTSLKVEDQWNIKYSTHEISDKHTLVEMPVYDIGLIPQAGEKGANSKKNIDVVLMPGRSRIQFGIPRQMWYSMDLDSFGRTTEMIGADGNPVSQFD